MEQDAIRNNIHMTPRDIFSIFLRTSYGLTPELANEATQFALDLFQLDDNGKLPIDWEIWYRGQA